MATQKNGLKSLSTKIKKAHLSKVTVSDVKKGVKKAALTLSHIKLPTVHSKKLTQHTKPKPTKEELINAESALGGKIFGPIPQGHRREFFLYRQNYWIFHESWVEGGSRKESTITYEVRKTGVYKNPLGSGYRKISGAELKNFCLAVREYQKLIGVKLYNK